MATSNSKSVRTALITIANADTTMRTLTGRTTRIMVPWQTIGTATKPVIAMMIVSNNRMAGDGDKRKVLVQLGAFAEGTGAMAKVDDMIQRCRELYTPTAFQAQGLDAAVLWHEAADRESTDDTDLTTATNIARVDLDLPIMVYAGI